VLVEGTAEDEAGGGVGGGVDGVVDGGADGEVEEEDLVDSMQALDIAHFAEVSPLLGICTISLPCNLLHPY